MNTAIDIITDLTDCDLLRIHKINDGKFLIYFIPDLAVVDCSRCDEELAMYYIKFIGINPEDDATAILCEDCYDFFIHYDIRRATVVH